MTKLEKTNTNDSALAPVSEPRFDPFQMLTQAVEKGASVETMERLLDMRRELKTEQAREAYYSALAGFQAECPIIQKTKEVKIKGEVRYRYAPLESIIKQVGPLLQKHGFSYKFKTIPGQNEVKICCDAYHKDGYADDSCFSIPIDEGAFMSDAQKAGSASTFAKRYAFCNVFGISTGDEDNDGADAGRHQVDEGVLYRRFTQQMKTVMDNIDTVLTIKRALAEGELDVAAEAWGEVCTDMAVYQNLAVAPTKGGCFDLTEKKLMGSDEFREALAKYREGMAKHEV